MNVENFKQQLQYAPSEEGASMYQPGRTPQMPRRPRQGRSQENPPSKASTGKPQPKDQTNQSRDKSKREGNVTKSRGRPESGRTSRDAPRGTARISPRQGRKVRNRTPTRGQTPERRPSQDMERPRKRGPPTLQGEEERKKNSQHSQKRNPRTSGPAQQPR